MIAKDNLPFSTVEKEGFQYLLRNTVSLYKIPSKKTITKLKEEKYQFLSGTIKTKMSAVDYFSLTADCWTDVHNAISY